MQTIQTPVAPQRRNLSLTKEQMLEAQEMFRTANKVTRPEKALILGFMAGSRLVHEIYIAKDDSYLFLGIIRVLTLATLSQLN